MSTLRERLKQSRLSAGKTQADVAETVGMSQPAYQALESGKNQKSSFLPMIANYLNVDVLWLTNGSSEKENSNNNLPKNSSIRISPVTFRESDGTKKTAKIPVYKNVRASCGSGIENFLEDASSYLDMDLDFLKLIGIRTKPENLKVIYSDEYSMWPTVAPDSPLFIDVSDKDPSALKNGAVYVFTHNHELRMKRIFVSYGSNQTVRLASDNPDKVRYPDEIITNEQLNEINFVGRLESAIVKP